MSNAPHLTLITELLPITRRDWPLKDPTLLNPVGVNPLLDGEWLQINAAYQMERGSGEAALPSFQLFAERGRYDTQAIGKVPVLFIGGYEADCDICNHPHSLTVGMQLVVTDVDIGDGQNRRGLDVASGSGEHLLVGWVTRVIDVNTIRFYKSPGQTWFHIT